MNSTERENEVIRFIESIIGERKIIIDRALEKYFPKVVDQAKLEFLCGDPSYEYDIDALNKAIYEPGWDLLDRGGKRWRPLLLMLVAESLGKSPDDIDDFLVIPEVVHNGTLMIDDIEDRSDLRRGLPCIHKIYGEDIAINAGNTMYFVPLVSLIKNRSKYPPDLILDIYEMYAQEMTNISHGQGTDIYWHRGNQSNATVDQYLQMCAYKTGTLARMSAKIGARLADAPENVITAFGKFAESTAVAFQIQDDVLNLKENLGKEFGEDIKEGKRSLLVIRALDVLPTTDAQRLIEILDMHTNDKMLIQEAIDLIKSTDAFDFAKGLSEKLVLESWNNLDPLIPESSAKSDLYKLAEYLIKRNR